MANKKISELPAAGALSGTELVEVVKGGVNSQTTAQTIADLGGGGPGGGTWGSITGTLADQTDLNTALTTNASETVAGRVEEATDAEMQAGTATGATGAKLISTPAKLVTWWTWLKTQAQTFAAQLTFTLSPIISAATGTGLRYAYFNAAGQLVRNGNAEYDTTSGATTLRGLSSVDSDYTLIIYNQAGDLIARFSNGRFVEYGGTSFVIEVNNSITSGNARVLFNDNQPSAFVFENKNGDEFVMFKTTTSDLSLVFRQKQEIDKGTSSIRVTDQAKLTLPNTTAATAHIVKSITVPDGYMLNLTILCAYAFATNGHVNNIAAPFNASLKRSGTTTTGTVATPTAQRITATTGGWSVVVNDTTEAADITFTNDTTTGRQYDCIVDFTYTLIPVPV